MIEERIIKRDFYILKDNLIDIKNIVKELKQKIKQVDKNNIKLDVIIGTDKEYKNTKILCPFYIECYRVSFNLIINFTNNYFKDKNSDYKNKFDNFLILFDKTLDNIKLIESKIDLFDNNYRIKEDINLNNFIKYIYIEKEYLVTYIYSKLMKKEDININNINEFVDSEVDLIFKKHNITKEIEYWINNKLDVCRNDYLQEQVKLFNKNFINFNKINLILNLITKYYNSEINKVDKIKNYNYNINDYIKIQIKESSIIKEVKRENMNTTYIYKLIGRDNNTYILHTTTNYNFNNIKQIEAKIIKFNIKNEIEISNIKKVKYIDYEKALNEFLQILNINSDVE